MIGLEQCGTDPVALALSTAEDMAFGEGRCRTPIAQKREIVELRHGACNLGMLGVRWFVEAEEAYAMTPHPDGLHLLDATHRDTFTFEGALFSIDRVRTKWTDKVGEIDTLCLTFDRLLFLPGHTTLPKDQLLQVPVLAINTISSPEV